MVLDFGRTVKLWKELSKTQVPVSIRVDPYLIGLGWASHAGHLQAPPGDSNVQTRWRQCLGVKDLITIFWISRFLECEVEELAGAEPTKIVTRWEKESQKHGRQM